MVMKHYPPEFRAEAVALYRSRPGATIKSVAQDLGVNHERAMLMTCGSAREDVPSRVIDR